jgi:hypothetical protein
LNVANLRLQGIAAALGELAGNHMEPDLAAKLTDAHKAEACPRRAQGAMLVELARS